MAERGVDQSELARRIGVTQGTISKILKGRSSKSRLLPRIAAELAVPITWLTGEDDSLVEGLILSIEDRELLDTLNQLPPTFRAAVLQLSRCVADLLQGGT